MTGDDQVAPDEGSSRRLFAIGDIHGCATALKTLIEAIDPQPKDSVTVLGDVIDWGPDSRQCVQQLIDLSARCQLILVRGNHEEMLFSALESELRSGLDLGDEETLRSYPYRGGDDFIEPAHVRFLKVNCRGYYETDDFIFVHASYDLIKPMAEQSNRRSNGSSWSRRRCDRIIRER
jgi:serine/threonine protein phosphatase 1